MQPRSALRLLNAQLLRPPGEGCCAGHRQDRPAAVQEARLQHCRVPGRLPTRLLAAEAGVYVRCRSSAPRSFFAGLAAAADVFGVTVGGILGHAMCTGGKRLTRRRCGADGGTNALHGSWTAEGKGG